MHDLIAIAGLLLVATITPGPNNLVVLREAGRDGISGALPSIAAIVLGGLSLFVMTAAGAGHIFDQHDGLREGLVAAGALYMSWLGLRLLANAWRDATTSSTVVLPVGGWGLFGFQFINPKGWALVLTVIAAWPATRLIDYLPLIALITLIPLACLLLWACSGSLLAPRLTCVRFRRRADTAMGILLLASVSLLLFDR